MLSTSSKSYNDSADLSYNKCQEARHNISSAIAHIADLLIYREGENREMILGRRCCTVYSTNYFVLCMGKLLLIWNKERKLSKA
jgi:hypothetical protein